MTFRTCRQILLFSLILFNTSVFALPTIQLSPAFPVHDQCQVIPESVMLPPQGTQKFELFGCPVDHWAATQGDIDSNGFYTAPAELGAYIITAHSTTGNQASTTVTVANVPVITPVNVWLEQGGNVTLNVVGGIPPYSWMATAGFISGSGNSVKYNAPDVSPMEPVTVTVTDNQGESFEAIIYVVPPLSANQAEIYIEPGQTTVIEVTGGVPPFDWIDKRGSMMNVRTEEPRNNFYSNVIGEHTITIMDRKGNVATVLVHVVSKLIVTPYMRYMHTQETRTFRVLGGVPPYSVTVIGDGNIESTISQDGIFKFTSGSTANGKVTIEVRDNISQTVLVYAFVAGEFSVSPEKLYVEKGGEAEFKVEGGFGNYSVFASCGFAEIDSNSGEGNYTAQNSYGECNITIVDDSSAQEMTIPVIVISEPVISPTIATMMPGESRTFMVSRGIPSYEWAFEGGTLKAMNSSNSVVQITVSEESGTYELSVMDAKGNIATATVTVFQPLLILPTSYPVYQGESVVVRFNKLGGLGVCDWHLGDLPEVIKGDDFVVVKPWTDVELGTQYVVACRDQNGDVAQSSIIVGTLLCDLDGSVSIDEQEVQICLDTFFNGENLNGVTINNVQLYVNIENFIRHVP